MLLPRMMLFHIASHVLLAASVLNGCAAPDPDAQPLSSDTVPVRQAPLMPDSPPGLSTAEAARTDAFVAAATTAVDFLRGVAEFTALSLADTVMFYLAPEGGGGLSKAAASDLRDRTAWSVRNNVGQTYVLVPPEWLTGLTTQFGRHLKCFEYDLASVVPELAGLPHVGARLEPANMTSCLQTWNLTFVFEADAMPPRLAAVVYDQWEW